MAFTPEFSWSAGPSDPSGLDPSGLSLTDNSTGSDPSIASRSVGLYKADKTLLTPLITWSLPVNPLILSGIMQKDYALNIVVSWLDGGGNTLYSMSQPASFTGYGQIFAFQLTQKMGAALIRKDANFMRDFIKLNMLIENAASAITMALSVSSAQKNIWLYQELMNRLKLNF